MLYEVITSWTPPSNSGSGKSPGSMVSRWPTTHSSSTVVATSTKPSLSLISPAAANPGDPETCSPHLKPVQLPVITSYSIHYTKLYEPLPGVSQLPIERDKDYLIELDSTGTGPAQGSLELVNAVLDAVNRDHRLLIVITA